MNKIYRVIWNTQLECWQAVSELAKNHNSNTSTANQHQTSSARSMIFTAVISFGLAILPLSIHAAISSTELPTDAQINSGSASFNQTSNTLNINQNSQNLSTNWNTFNIGQDATVNFNQPNQSSTAINHVLDNNASQIMGRLNANGQVFLLNPNGVVFSKTAQVNVGGLVASTLNLNDADIQNGKYTLKGDANSTASIENQGSIQTLAGGTVALIAPNVKNTGTISTPNGTTHLTSASQVTLALQDGSLTQYQVDQGVLQGLVDNGGAIIADNGAVYLTAKAKDSLSKAVVNHSGIIEANRLTQNAKGEIILLGDMQTGETHVSGTLKAEGKNGQDGGFIETSAAHVEIAADTKVSTASDIAKSGLWLIDPVDITIDTAKATAIQTALNSGDVTVTTTDSAANLWGTNAAGTAKGDIHVNSAISWSSNQALTLRADNDININADITATGATGKLNLKYGQTTSNTNANYYLNNGAKVNLKAGDNFSTQKGTEAVKQYKVITALGAAGSTTGTDLQGIKGNLTQNYVLGADIDATLTSSWNNNQGFQPIGDKYSKFKGDFVGLGHEIKNLFINRPNEQHVGLFGYIENSATNWGFIRDLHLKNVNIAGHLSVGGVAGSADYVNLNNVLVSGKVKAVTNSDNAIYAGGIFGNGSYSKLDQVSFSGEITAEALNQNWAYGGIFLGGLLGWSTAGSFNNVETQGKINGKVVDKQYQQRNNLRIGGLVGQHQQGIMTNAKSSANIVADTTQGDYSMAYAGGLVGYSFVNIYDSEFSGTLTANGRNTSAGGILGHFQGNRLEDVKNYGSIKLDSQYGTVGGIAGSIYYPIISFPFNADLINVENYGNITAKNVSGSFQVGGLVGQSRSSIQNSKSVGTIDIQSASTRNIIVGGLVGTQMDDQKSISSSSSSGTITINSTGSEKISAGGIVGHNTGTLSLTDIRSDIKVIASATNSTNDMAVGGIVGLNTKEIGILNNHYTGEIISNSSKGLVFAGGLVGRSDNTNNISQSSASSNVTANGSGNVFAGGLVGHHVAGEISDSQASGNVSGSSALAYTYVGGLIGLNRTSKITQVSASGNITGKNNVGGLIGANGDALGDGGEISDVYATGTVLGTADNVGGLIGYNSKGSLTDISASGSVSGRYQVGGLVGNNVEANITNAKTASTSIVTGHSQVGGLIGSNGIKSIITESHAKGNVQGGAGSVAGDVIAGGLIGINSGTISKSFAEGIVTASPANNSITIGGLVGENKSIIIDSIALGGEARVNSSQANTVTVGGLVGHNTVEGSVSNSSAQKEINLNTTKQGATLIGGSLVGINDGNIQSSMATGNIAPNSGILSTTNGGKAWLGGLVGLNTSTIADSNASGKVEFIMLSGSGGAGGLVGNNSIKGSISRSFASGQVKLNSSTSYAGGLVGVNEGNINYSNAKVGTVQGINAGGLVGYNATTAFISDSYAEGAITSLNSTGNAGGLVAVNAGKIENSHAQGEVHGQDNVGGLVGLNENGTIDHAYAEGQVSGERAVGGLVGSNKNGAISVAHATGDVSSSSYAGGLVGLNQEGTISQTYATGNIEAKSNGNGDVAAGGLIGKNITGKISSSYATGNVLSSNSIQNRAGGLVGWNLQSSVIENSYATGNATAELGDTNAGGLVGLNQGSQINNAYATGQANATTTANINLAFAGGLVGYNAGSIANAYATGRVSSSIHVGGLVGFHNAGSISTSYWNTETTGQTIGVGGYSGGSGVTGLTTADMTIGSKFVFIDADSYLGGKNTVWRIYEGQTTPLLRSFLTQANIGKVANQTKTYNGQLQGLDLSSVNTAGLDTSKLFSNNQSNSKNVGTYNLGYYSNQQGYDLIGNSATLTINPANLILTTTDITKTYDGTRSANGTVIAANGTQLLNTDNLSGGTFEFADKNAGSNKVVHVSGVTINDGNNGNNYNVSYVNNTKSSILKAAINAISGITANNRAYDGTKDAALNSGSAQFSGIVAGDQLTVASATGQFNDKNAGNGKTVNISGISLGGSDAANYTLASNTATTTADISKATIANVAGITANNRAYDGTKDVALNSGSAQFSGIVAGDQLTVATATGQFNDKNAGNGKTVNISGISLGGSDAANYTLASNTATTTADIAKAQATVTANSINTVYNGKGQTASGFTATGLVNGEDESVLTAVTASVTAKDAGKYVNTATGTDKNYDLTFINGSLDIAKAKITQVNGITASNRVYDATSNATLNTNAAQFDGIVAGDQLTVATATGQFNDKNVGTAKNVAISNISLIGADVRNYELVNTTAQTTADINKANINNITGITANNRTYDGLTHASLNTENAQFNGIYAGDQLTVATATGQFDEALPGQGKTVRISGFSLGGIDAQNYHLLDSTALTTADINLLTPAAYLQAIQFRRPRYLPDTNNALNTINIELRQGGINTSGIQTLAGEH